MQKSDLANENPPLAISLKTGEYFALETLTINLEDEVARRAKDSALREHKSVSEWIGERIKFEVSHASALADLEARAAANGYPSGWLALYGSLAEEETFASPARSPFRLLKDEV